MTSLNSIALGLSLTFGCLLVALMGEIYYLLWWKRRSWNRGISEDNDCCSSTCTSSTSSSSAREFMYMFCCNKSTRPLSSCSSTVSLTVTDRFQQQSENQNSINKSNNKDLVLLKSDGPPRLLFTIKEETREDLESEDENGRVSVSSARSWSDLVVVQNSIVDTETPYLTLPSSPSMFTPPLTPLNSYTHLGFNPLFESLSDAELSRLKASPPPKFKFLQEAEDKFQRRRMKEEAEKQMDHFNDGCGQNEGENPESFITIIVAKATELDSWLVK